MRVRAAKKLYVSPVGSDTASGTSPVFAKRTLAAAAVAMGGCGTLVMLAGDYVGDTLDVSRLRSLNIVEQGEVNVLLGEKVDTFTLHSGTTWKTAITTVIPQDRTFNSNNDFLAFVFEWGTPEGLLDATNAEFAPAGRTHRLQHYRLRWGASKDTLTAGQFFYESGTLYIHRTDSTDPNGHDYWIPNQSSAAFVKGGTAITKISVSGVNVFFANNGMDVSGCKTYTLTDCLLYGNAAAGVLYNSTSCTGVETDCEYAANANDGRGVTCANAGAPITSTVTRPWVHDNGDEGVSDHNVGCFSTYADALLEYNAQGGSTWVQGAPVVFTNPHTRYNTYGLHASVGQTVGTVTGWLSENDTYSAAATGNSTLTFSGSTILSPVTAALYAGSAGDTINASGTSGVTNPRVGGGTFNVS
jgi:hypothetical protein